MWCAAVSRIPCVGVRVQVEGVISCGSIHTRQDDSPRACFLPLPNSGGGLTQAVLTYCMLREARSREVLRAHLANHSARIVAASLVS